MCPDMKISEKKIHKNNASFVSKQKRVNRFVARVVRCTQRREYDCETEGVLFI